MKYKIGDVVLVRCHGGRTSVAEVVELREKLTSRHSYPYFVSHKNTGGNMPPPSLLDESEIEGIVRYLEGIVYD